MKHLFFIQSHLTEAMACSTARYLKLKPEDTIVIRGRNFEASLEWASCTIQAPTDSVPLPSKRKVMDVIRYLNKFDEWFDSFCSEDFHFYAPQIAITLLSMIANHPKCNGYSYLEEGLASYCIPFEAPIRGSLLTKFWPWKRIRRRMFYEYGFRDLYVSKSDAFPEVKEKVVIQPSFRPNRELPTALMGNSDRGVVFVVQTVEAMERLEASAYYQVLRDEIERFVQAGNTIYYKLHPSQMLTDECSFVREMMNKYSAIELSQDVCIEVLMESHPNVLFVTRNSSAVMYSKTANPKLLLISKHLSKYIPSKEDELSLEMEFFQRAIGYPKSKLSSQQ